MKIVGLDQYVPAPWDMDAYLHTPHRLSTVGKSILEALMMSRTPNQEVELLKKKVELPLGTGYIRNVFYQPLSQKAAQLPSQGFPKVREIWSVTDAYISPLTNECYLRPNLSPVIPEYRPLFVIVSSDKHRFERDNETGIIHHFVPVHLILPLCVSYKYHKFVSFCFPAFKEHTFALITDQGSCFIHRDLLGKRVLRIGYHNLQSVKNPGISLLKLPGNEHYWDGSDYSNQQHTYVSSGNYNLISEDYELLTKV